MIKLYDFPLSGHAHKVRLMLSLLDIKYERKEVALAQGEQHSERFLQLNPFHHVPVLEDGDFVIRDSNAIITYLAKKYAQQWYPSDALSSARIQEWLAVSTKEVVEGPGVARLINLFGAKLDHPTAIAKSHELLAILEVHLSKQDWLALERVSVADIALYSYIAHAPEGDVSLENYPNVTNWLARIEALEGFVGMPKSKIGLAA